MSNNLFVIPANVTRNTTVIEFFHKRHKLVKYLHCATSASSRTAFCSKDSDLVAFCSPQNCYVSASQWLGLNYYQTVNDCMVYLWCGLSCVQLDFLNDKTSCHTQYICTVYLRCVFSCVQLELLTD